MTETSHATLISTTLISTMNGKPATNRWDIVVSYSEDQLNDFLRKSYEDGPVAKHKQVRVQAKEFDPLTGTPYTIYFTINFGAPTLQFSRGLSDHVRLTMPIDQGSQYSVVPDGAKEPLRTVDIPGGVYSVVAVVPLAAISGDTRQLVNQGRVVGFGPGGATDQYVVLHFKNEKGAAFHIEPSPKGDDAILTHFLVSLNDYFQEGVNEIDYVLAGVNNSGSDNGTTTRGLYTPKAFAFASTGDEQTGCLSLFIQTVESGNPAGDPAPSFQPGDVELPPVPPGHTASVILSHDLVTTFLKRQLEEAGFSVNIEIDDPENLGPANPKGMRGAFLTLKKNVSVVRGAESGTFLFGGCSYEGLDISMTDYPLHLGIIDGTASVHWTGKAVSDWSSSGGGAMGSAATQYGKVDVTIELTKGPMTIDVSNKGIDFPRFTFGREDFKVHTRGHGCSFWERLAGCGERVPSFYSKDMPLQLPDISFATKDLNYFFETNLLEPGKQMINIDSEAGLGTPYDFVIVGDVAAA